MRCGSIEGFRLARALQLTQISSMSIAHAHPSLSLAPGSPRTILSIRISSIPPGRTDGQPDPWPWAPRRRPSRSANSSAKTPKDKAPSAHTERELLIESSSCILRADWTRDAASCAAFLALVLTFAALSDAVPILEIWSILNGLLPFFWLFLLIQFPRSRTWPAPAEDRQSRPSPTRRLLPRNISSLIIAFGALRCCRPRAQHIQLSLF